MITNPVVMLTHNNLALTKAAINSVRAQDIDGISLIIVENGSTDGTKEWLRSQEGIRVMHRTGSVAECWNQALKWLFASKSPYALVVNNDVELPGNYYRCLVEENAPFASGIATDRREQVRTGDPPKSESKRYHPDFSAYLIRKECYETVGPFDEKFLGAYCEDCDYHVRMFEAGIRAYCIDLPYYHIRSATIKNSPPEQAAAIQEQAERNRRYFYRKHGFKVESRQYWEHVWKDSSNAGVLPSRE